MLWINTCCAGVFFQPTFSRSRSQPDDLRYYFQERTGQSARTGRWRKARHEEQWVQLGLGRYMHSLIFWSTNPENMKRKGYDTRKCRHCYRTLDVCNKDRCATKQAKLLSRASPRCPSCKRLINDCNPDPCEAKQRGMICSFRLASAHLIQEIQTDLSAQAVVRMRNLRQRREYEIQVARQSTLSAA